MAQHGGQVTRNTSTWRRVGIGCGVVALAATGVISAQADPAPDSGHAYPAKAAIDGRDRPTNDAKRTTDVYLAGDQVEVKCQTEGDEVGGSRLWIYTSKNVYIPDYLVKTGTDGFIPGVPKCDGGENPPPEEQPSTKPRVVAMGDSYASGEGTFGYDVRTDDEGRNECHRSPKSWQRNVNLPGLGVSSPENPNIDYQQVACSGAVTDNILREGQWGEPKQLDALHGNEDYVLLSIGGNDLGFSDTVQRCIGLIPDTDKKTARPCWSMPEVTKTKDDINRFLAPNGAFETTIKAIHQKAPNAKIVLAGYPQLFGQPFPGIKGCTGITRDEAAYVDGLASYLAKETRSKVQGLAGQGTDIRYAETIPEFNGHEACTGLGPQWINSLQKPIFEEGADQQPEMFHPNDQGQQAYVRAVQKVL